MKPTKYVVQIKRGERFEDVVDRYGSPLSAKTLEGAQRLMRDEKSVFPQILGEYVVRPSFGA